MYTQSAKQCVKIMGLVFLAALASIAVFNVLMDPYDIFGWPEKRRPLDLVNLSHITKAVNLVHKKPDTIIIGSSIVDAGFKLPGSMTVYHENNFETNQAYLQSLIPAHTNIYNAGLRSGGMGDIYHYMQHAINNNPNLKHIILGLEWNLFGGARKADKFLPETPALGKTYVPFTFYANEIFSFGATYDAIRTLYVGFVNQLYTFHMYMKTQQSIDLVQHIKHLHAQYQAFKRKHQHDFVIQNIPYNVIPNPVIIGETEQVLPTIMFSILTLSAQKHNLVANGESVMTDEEAYVYLRKIIKLAKEHDIKLDIYVSPQHATYWETIKRFGMQKYPDQWLEKLASITSFWDFSGKIDFSPEVDKYFDTDTLHFNFNAGEVILPAIMNNRTTSGVSLITANNVNELIRKRHLAQEQWLNGNRYVKEIFDHEKFMQSEKINGDIEKSTLTRYAPAMNGYQILKFMDKFIALPQSDKPYDFRLFFTENYKGIIHGSSFKDIQDKIIAQKTIS